MVPRVATQRAFQSSAMVFVPLRSLNGFVFDTVCTVQLTGRADCLSCMSAAIYFCCSILPDQQLLSVHSV